jgi:hypothetical protein
MYHWVIDGGGGGFFSRRIVSISIIDELLSQIDAKFFEIANFESHSVRTSYKNLRGHQNVYVPGKPSLRKIVLTLDVTIKT